MRKTLIHALIACALSVALGLLFGGIEGGCAWAARLERLRTGSWSARSGLPGDIGLHQATLGVLMGHEH